MGVKILFVQDFCFSTGMLCSRFLFLYRYVVFLTDYGPTAALESPQTGTSEPTATQNPPFYLYAPDTTGLSQYRNISEFLQSFHRLQETLHQPHSQIISNIHFPIYRNPYHAVWSVDNNGHLFQVQITAIDKIFQQRLLNRLYSIYNDRCNYWTTPDNRHEQLTAPCKQLHLPLPTNLRKSMLEHMLTQESLSLYLERKGLRPKGSAWPPADAVRHCMLHSVISPSFLQAVRVADILKRNTVLIMPTNSHIWTPELVYLPGDIDRLIAQSLLESADNHNCIQNYLLSYKVQVTSTGAGNTVTSSNNDVNTGSNGSVTDGLKIFTHNSAEISWNEEKKERNFSDMSCTESNGHTSKAGDITFATTARYNSGGTAETTATYTKQIQRNTAASYDQIPAETKTTSQIEIPVTNTTAHANTAPGKGKPTYRWEVKENTNATAYQKETLNKTTTSYRNIHSEVATVYHRKLQDAPTVDIKPAAVKTTTPYQDELLVKNMNYLSDFRVQRTTNDGLDDGTTITEFATARNLPKTTYDDLDDRKIITEFATARNLPKTTNDDLDDGKRITEFSTARNLLKTTNDELEDTTTTTTEFVTAWKLLQTVVHGMYVGNTQATYTSAWNLLKTTTSISSDSTTDTAYLTPMDVFQRSTGSLKGSTTNPELVSTTAVLHTATGHLTDITEDIQHDIRVTPFEEQSGGLRACEEIAASKGTQIQLEVTTSSSSGSSGSLETVDTTEPQSECSNCLVQSATQTVSDLIQISSQVLKDTITTSADDLANQPLPVATSSSTEPTGNPDHDTMTEVKSDAKDVTHINVSSQAMPVTEESLSNVNNASHVTLDKDADIFGQTTEYTQALYNSTSTDIFEIMEQMVNSTISPAELLTLQILYELLLSQYQAGDIRDDMSTLGGTNSTGRVPQNGVSSEIRNTVHVLEHIPGIMDDRILDNVTDEEINSLREAVEYVWYLVKNDTERNMNGSLVGTYQVADHFWNASTPRSKRQTTEGVLGQQAELYKSVGSPLGFIIRNVSYNEKNGLERKKSSLVTGNVITGQPPQDIRNSHEEGNLLWNLKRAMN